MDRSCVVRSRLTLHGNCAASVSRRLNPLLERLQQSGPAAIDILAHRLARLGAHLLELAVFELDAGCIRAVGDESHLDLGGDGRIRLPRLLMSHVMTKRLGGSHTMTLPTFVRVPSSASSYQWPPTRVSMTAAFRGVLPIP